MADLNAIHDYLRAHRDELAGEVAAGLAYELDNVAKQWDREDDKARWLELTRDVVGRYPEVLDTLEQQGLLPDEWKAEPLPVAVPPQANASAASPTHSGDAAAAPPPVSQPTGEKEMDKPTAAPSTTDRLALWDKGLTIGKEAITGCLGILIVLVTLVVAMVTVFAAGTDQTWARAKDVLIILVGLVGVVLGYYFGRIPGEARAAKAEGEAQAASSELHETKGEVRGMLAETEVAKSRGMSDTQVELSPDQARRLWELVNR